MTPGLDKVGRTIWPANTPNVITHTTVRHRDNHPDYVAGKSGDRIAASRLITDIVNDAAIDQLRLILGHREPLILPVYAIETSGRNVIPDVFAHDLAVRLDLRVNTTVIQINLAGHTRAGGFERLARPALFMGPIERGRDYLLVDDHVGMGGTLANLRGHVETNGGTVILMTTLTQSRDSHHIALTQATLLRLREKHGDELERYWRDNFGYGLEALTEPEAGYLLRTPDVERIRNRILAAKR